MSSQSPRGFERPIPRVAWLPMLIVVAAVTLLLLSAWEIAMRGRGLRAGDLDDGRDFWAVERRKLDTAPRDSVVIIGDSRILFDTDLATWERLTGGRPIQLALMGGNAQHFLHDLAMDEYFAGLVVIGTAEFSYFYGGANPRRPSALKHLQTQSPSQRLGHQIQLIASRYLAFLDSNYTLFTLIERHDWPERPGVKGPHTEVWKISESYEDRQTHLWPRLEQDAYLRERAAKMWPEIFAGPPVADDVVGQVIANTKADIDRIRSRGGEVVWVRPPSMGPVIDIERARYPREKVWDRLLDGTESFGVHFEDHAAMLHLQSPDGSHLPRAAAAVFTEAYVQVLLENVAWLKAEGRGRRRMEEPSEEPS